MTSKPTSTSALGAMLRLLRARDHFECEIESKLRAKGFPDDEIADALADGRRRGYLNDLRLASRLAQRVQAEKLWSTQRIREHLIAKGCRESAADAACSGLEPDRDVARRLLHQDLGRARSDAARQDIVRRSARRLAAAGYDPETIESVLCEVETG